MKCSHRLAKRASPTVTPERSRRALVLFFSAPLQREPLEHCLSEGSFECVDSTGLGSRRPDLVIWSRETGAPAESLLREASLLDQRWYPIPLLALLPAGLGLAQERLEDLPCAGVLQSVKLQPQRFRHAVQVLLDGGRIFDVLRDDPQVQEPSRGFAAFFLRNLEDITRSLAHLRRQLGRGDLGPWSRRLLEGRERELILVRRLLLWLWAPLAMAFGFEERDNLPRRHPAAAASPALAGETVRSTELTLRSRTAEGIWDAISSRLRLATEAQGLEKGEALLALQAFRPQQRQDLLLTLLVELERALLQLRQVPLSPDTIEERWDRIEQTLLQQVLMELTGPYTQLQGGGQALPVRDRLKLPADLPRHARGLLLPLLRTLVSAEPVLVEGALVAPDQPRALFHLELLLSDWLLGMAIVVAEVVIESCSSWPELRRVMLDPEYLPTRNLERLRNQINTRTRLINLFVEPVRIYESRRELLLLGVDGVERRQLLEPRDAELEQMGPLQRLVTLALEARDALGPQLRQAVERIGRGLVLLLTQVIGRAIGLVGKGILIGLGRSMKS